MFDIGMGKVTLLSAGGAVTPSVMIRDIIVHEEFRNKGVKVLLNDIGLVRLEPRSPMPPAACALCLPNSDLDLMDRHCDETSLIQVKPKSLNPDLQIGSPLVCSGGMLAGVASNRSPEFVFTPISDYVTWIRTNRKIKDDQNEAWK